MDELTNFYATTSFDDEYHVGRCARCGHETPTCPRCDREDNFLGGYVPKVGSLCHTFVGTSPTCYELTIGRLVGDLDAAETVMDDATHVPEYVMIPADEFERWLSTMNDVPTAPTTSGGVELTDDVVERLADEAERGYDVDHLRDRARERSVARHPTTGQPSGCPCECNFGGFCGGCGHAGCGRR